MFPLNAFPHQKNLQPHTEKLNHHRGLPGCLIHLTPWPRSTTTSNTYTVSFLYRSPIGHIRSRINPYLRPCAALLVTLAFIITTYVTYVSSSSLHGTVTVAPVDVFVGIGLAATIIALTVAGVMLWRTRPQLEARRLGWQLYWLARPHVLEEGVWREVMFEVDVEMADIA
jgi:hypothetical protein